jgi:hypothetical protein
MQTVFHLAAISLAQADDNWMLHMTWLFVLQGV